MNSVALNKIYTVYRVTLIEPLGLAKGFQKTEYYLIPLFFY